MATYVVSYDCATASTGANDCCWTTWNASATDTSANVDVHLWGQWNQEWYQLGDVQAIRYHYGNTEVEIAERERQQEAVKDAARKAEELLVKTLSPAERAKYERYGYVEVNTDSGQQYRIKKGVAGNVVRMEGDREVERYCIHPDVSIPVADVMLAQRLLLLSDEATFRRIANCTRL